jgi:class 3 adenylate cyclase/tetratricopeptide (TPR) repeat protein
MTVCASCATRNPPQAKFCLECGAALAVEIASPARRLVTVLFCDLVGSTALGEQLDPETLSLVMQRYYEAMRGAVERHGGLVEKFIGDAVCGVFGLPLAHEDDALRAARAALDMHAAIPELNTELAPLGATLQIRIGLHSGEVLTDEQAARVGAVAGDAFNTAARLQTSAAPGETIVGDAAARLLGDAASLVPLDELELKGKERAVAAFRLDSVSERRAVRASTPLIGRQRALATLRGAYEDAVLDRACVLVTVLGLPGIGKSRLAAEFTTSLGFDAAVLVGHTLAYGEGRALAPVIDMLHAAAASPGADARTVAGLLRARLAGVADGEAVADRLADLLGVGPGAAGGETSWALRRLFERLAETRPLIVVVDDVHWADESLLELLDGVVEDVRASVLVLCLARPELLDQRPNWAGGKRRAVTVTLEPLPEGEAAELASLLVAGPGLEAMISSVARASEGNPLYLEQYAAMVAESGDLELSVPPSLQALLASRLDALDPGDAGIASVAAVQGREFSVSMLGRLVDSASTTDVPRALGRLERRDLVRPVDERRVEWTFAHGLVRDAAERRLPKRSRAELHERLARLLALEDDGDEETVGLHFERAAALRSELAPRDATTIDLETEAGRHLAVAGGAAFARLDLLAAAGLLGRAANLLPAADPERLTLIPDLGTALAEIGRPEEALRLLEAAVSDARSAGLTAEGLRATVQLLSTRIYLGPNDLDLDRAGLEARSVIVELERIGDHSGLAQAWIVMVYLDEMRGRMATAPEACVRAIEHARACGRLREEIQAAGDLPGYLVSGWSTPDAILEVASRLPTDDVVVEATAMVLRALAAALRGDLEQFVKHDRDARSLTGSRGLDFLAAAHTWPLAVSLLELGEAGEAERRLGEASAFMHRAGDLWWERELETTRVNALLSLQNTAEAAALLAAVDAFEAPQSLLNRIEREFARAQIALDRGQPEQAVEHARESLRLAVGSDLVFGHTGGLETLARVEAARGHEDESRRALAEALAIHERKGCVPGAARVRATLSQGSPAASGAP